MRDDPPRQEHFVQSLARGLSVIRVFDEGSAELTLSQVAHAAGLSRAAARRFLLTLVDLGYLRFDGKLFRLTPRVLDLGYAYLSSLSLPGLAGPHLERLSAQTGESSSMSVLDAGEIVYVARVPTSRIMSVAISVGTRFPAYATAMGRVLLSGLTDDELDEFLRQADLAPLTRRTLVDPDAVREAVRAGRAQGWAFVDEELEEGLRAVAAPVRDASGAIVAAINVSAHVRRASRADIRRRLVPALLEAVARIEADGRR